MRARCIAYSVKADLGLKATAIAATLSTALCYINRTVKSSTDVRVQARILVLAVSDDLRSQSIPMMNCIFSAQKSGIPIDVCALTSGDSLFLNQAADLTQGIYLRVTNVDVLGQYLLVRSFLALSFFIRCI